MGTPTVERVLMDTLLEMKLARRKAKKNFIIACWAQAIAKVKEKTGLEPSINNAKNKFKNWRQRYREVKQLLTMSGFGWDDTTKMVTTAPEDVWGALEQAKSKLAKYKNITIKFYDELHDLIADDTAEGNIAMTGSERSQVNVDSIMIEEEDFIIPSTFDNQTAGLDDIDEPHLPHTNVNSPENGPALAHQSSSGRMRKKRKSTTSNEVKETLKDVANVVRELAERMNNPYHSILIPKITGVVRSLSFIPSNMKMHIIDFLASDDRKAETFLSFNDDEKMRRLEMHFQPGSSSGAR